MPKALEEILGVSVAARRWTVLVEGIASQEVEADEWKVVGQWVAFGSQLDSNRPQIILAVPKDKVLYVRLES